MHANPRHSIPLELRAKTVTLEQTMPYSPLIELAVKGIVYDAIEKRGATQ